MITARAPGKVVLWGEYAVLLGAPAAVLAIDRYATCTIDVGSHDSENWRIETRGINCRPVEHPLHQLLATPTRSSAVIHHVLKALPQDGLADLTKGITVQSNTDQFHLSGRKLGVGSSAAICVATYVACAELLGVQPHFDHARSIHTDLQEKKGSGVDVAAAWYGGALRYESGTTQPLPQLNPANWQFLWAGASANTVSHINRFQTWINAGTTVAVDDLAELSQQLFNQLGATGLYSKLRDYTAALRRLDQAANLGIYGEGHERLHQLALDWQVVYKPCGAGGGDVGAAVGEDPDELAAFIQAATDLGYHQIATTRADHGVHISR